MAPKLKPILSLTELSRRSKMSLTTVSKIFNGRGPNRRNPSLRTAQKLAKAQGMSLEEFLKQLSQIQGQAS